jgi:hypothetical protein
VIPRGSGIAVSPGMAGSIRTGFRAWNGGGIRLSVNARIPGLQFLSELTLLNRFRLAADPA